MISKLFKVGNSTLRTNSLSGTTLRMFSTPGPIESKVWKNADEVITPSLILIGYF
jgi:hypothetical protein